MPANARRRAARLALLSLPLQCRTGAEAALPDRRRHVVRSRRHQHGFQLLHQAGDALAGVYSSTLLYWLNDRSPGSEATWGFLDRRIDDVMKIEKLKARVKSWTGGTTRTRFKKVT